MNYKEAIEAIQDNYPPKHYTALREALDLAIELMKKQIPTKPIIELYSPAKCPSCGKELSESVGDGYYKHLVSMKVCDCGQKLEWE